MAENSVRKPTIQFFFPETFSRKLLSARCLPCPVSPHPFHRCFSYWWAKMYSLTAAHKCPNTALHCPAGTRMPLSPQEGHKSSQKGRHGHPGFRAAPGQDYWQRNYATKSEPQFFFLKLFRENRSRQKAATIVLCGVIFSRSLFPRSNFFKIFRFRQVSLSLLLFVLLIYFLPISWRGSPPPDGGWEQKWATGFFLLLHLILPKIFPSRFQAT